MMQDNWSDLIKQLWWEMTPQHNKHGSNKIFEVFDDNYIGTGYGLNLHGRGHYTTPEKWFAEGFGKKVYGVDIPNKNYLYKTYDSFSRDNPVNFKPIKQSKFVLDNLNKTPKNIDYFNMLPLDDTSKIADIASDLPVARYKDSKAPWRMIWNIYDTIDSGKKIKPWQKDLFNRIMNKSGLDAKAIYLDRTGNNHLLKLVSGDIKGISSFDEFDAPINVIFSDKDIKMSNNPIQYIKNRIPTQTLGKIAEKIMSNPVVKVGGKVIERTAVPLMVYDMLQSPVDAGTLPFEGNYNTIRQDFMPLSQGLNPLLLQGGIQYNDYR